MKNLSLWKSLRSLAIIAICCYAVFSPKQPARVKYSMKAGVEIKDSITDAGEMYVFSNKTDTQKVVLGFHFQEMNPLDPPPFFKLVLPPHGQVKTQMLSDSYVDQLRVCEFDCKTADTKPLAYLNAHRLRNGYKD